MTVKTLLYLHPKRSASQNCHRDLAIRELTQENAGCGAGGLQLSKVNAKCLTLDILHQGS